MYVYVYVYVQVEVSEQCKKKGPPPNIGGPFALNKSPYTNELSLISFVHFLCRRGFARSKCRQEFLVYL